MAELLKYLSQSLGKFVNAIVTSDHDDATRPVLCVACDPPAVYQVPVTWRIDVDNYVCTVCIARVLKRIERAELVVGRRSHGAAGSGKEGV